MTSRISRISMNNTDFMLKKLASECHPLQFLRELTENAIQAIERMQHLIPGYKGKIIWGYDETFYSHFGVLKLCITDNGDGMTGPEMVKFINQLASGYNKQDISGNYGIGAKISTLPKNPEGVIYQSWKYDPVAPQLGAMVHSCWDQDEDAFGLLRQIKKDPASGEEFVEDWAVLSPTINRPFPHGTRVILMGTSHNEDTTKPPTNIAAYRWIIKYLNSRYFIVPDNITIQAVEGLDNLSTAQYRTAVGMKSFLDEYAKASGVMGITGANVHWWVLKDEQEDPMRRKRNDVITCSGHVATLYQGELYDFYSGREGLSKLQDFGITFGTSQVVLYVEPTNGINTVSTNSARTNLLINQMPPPWADWQQEFSEKMPQEIRDFMNNQYHGKSKSNIQELLKDIMDLYKLKFYKAKLNNRVKIEPPIFKMEPGGADTYLTKTEPQSQPPLQPQSKLEPGSEPNPPSWKPSREPQRDGVVKMKFTVGDIYSTATSGSIQATEVARTPFPQTQWYTKAPNVELGDARREEDDMENRFGKYVASQHLIMLNADFPPIQDDILRFTADIRSKKPNLTAEAITTPVTQVVRRWYELLAVETVMGVQKLRGLPGWPQSVVEMALSEEALTAAAMHRYHTNFAVKRELGSMKLLSNN